MNKQKRVFVAGGSHSYYTNWFPPEWSVVFDDTISAVDDSLDSPSDVDLILFTGGEDVSPNYYADEYGKYTTFNTSRDEEEAEIYLEGIANSIPMLGICRGAQFLTVMSGGKLIQHVSNHGLSGTHSIRLMDGTRMEITSTHHQMMYPYNMGSDCFRLLGWANMQYSDTYLNGKDEEMDVGKDFLEPEIVYYPYTNCLGIQGHPEHLDYNHDTNKKLRQLLISFLNNELV